MSGGLNRHVRDALLAAARTARRHAYAPYSRYAVGAAVLGDNEEVYAGANVENASYGLTICAERSAVAAAVAAGVHRLRAVAVVADGALPLPCGACRQVLVEFMQPDAVVWVAGADPRSRVKQFRLGDLLPEAFRLDRHMGSQK